MDGEPTLAVLPCCMQALVDRCLNSLQPFAVTTGFFSLNSTPCLVYRSPFQQQTVRHHPLDYGPSYPLHALAGGRVVVIQLATKRQHTWHAPTTMSAPARQHNKQTGHPVIMLCNAVLWLLDVIHDVRSQYCPSTTWYE